MTRWERWTFGAFVIAVAATGLAYFWMKYLLTPTDPFAVINHPWQPLMLAAHVVASPALILMFGILLRSHVLQKIDAPGIQNRRSGLASFAGFFVMAASGYLLQVVTAEALLKALVVVHIASGALFAVAYLVHFVISVRLARQAPAPRAMRTA